MRAHPAGPRHGEQVAAHAAPLAPVDPAALHALDPAVWPRSAARDAGRQPGAEAMTVGGVDVRDLAGTYGTPPYVLDEADVRARMAACARRRLRRTRDVYYAGKAFLCDGDGPLGRRGGARPRRLHRRRARRRTARRLPGRADRVARQQQVERGDRPGARRPGSAASSSTPSRRSAARRRSTPTSAGCGRGVLRARHRRRRGAHPRVHRHRPRGPEVRVLPRQRRGGRGGAPGRSRCRSLELVGLHSHIGSQIFDTAGFEVSAHRRRRAGGRGPRRARRRGRRARPRRRPGHRLRQRRRPARPRPRSPSGCATSSTRSAPAARAARAAAVRRAGPRDRRPQRRSPSTRSAR